MKESYHRNQKSLPAHQSEYALKEQADEDALRMAANATEAMNQRLDSIMRKNIETGFVLGANQAHQIFRIEPTFDLLDDGAVRWMNNRAAEMVTRINEETRQRLAETLSRGARAGDSTATLAKRIRSEVNAMADISKGRAHLIATTELNNAMSEASLQTYTRLGVTGKSWSTVGDDRVSDDCLDNESAGVIPMDATFPGGVGRPPQHPDCLLPGNKILPLGMINMTRAFYSGQVIELLTRGGNKLTVTPNHPVLTPSGFVSAESLNEGNYIISCPDSERMIATINPDYDYIPTAIEEIWDSLFFSSGMAKMSMEVSSIDFHGDARFFDGDVDIINTNRFLRNYITDTLYPKHISEDKLSLGSPEAHSFNGYRSLFPLGDSGFPAFNSFMGSGNPGHSLDRRHQGHASNVGLATVPRRDTSRQQSPANERPAYTELSRQFQLRFASLIATDELVKIRYYNYSGHVYNLQSLEQLYIGSNIIVKNCRCTLVPERQGAPEPTGVGT